MLITDTTLLNALDDALHVHLPPAQVYNLHSIENPETVLEVNIPEEVVMRHDSLLPDFTKNEVLNRLLQDEVMHEFLIDTAPDLLDAIEVDAFPW